MTEMVEKMTRISNSSVGFRMSISIVTMVMGLSVSAFVPMQFFAPFPQVQTQDQMLRRMAAAQGVDVSDVPAGQLTSEKVVERLGEKIKRESGPRADAIVRQYVPSEADFLEALNKANTPESILSLRTDLQQRAAQIAFGCCKVGCSDVESVKRALPVMEQLDRVGKKIDRLPAGERARFDALDRELQARLQAQNDAMRAMNNQILNNLIQQTSQPLPLSTGVSGGSDVSCRRKSIKSVGHCPIHGSYELALGCPGCKGNVDYGSGKQMHCSKHNLNFDSAIGCPLCNRIGDEGRFAPTWR